jgi:hypothetical protein
MKPWGSVSAIALVSLVATSCSGAGIPAPPAAAPASRSAERVPAYGARVRAHATARVSIRIPRKHVRRGRFIAPSTRALSITIDPGSAAQVTVDANLTPGSPGCSNGVCTIVVNPTVGRHLFDVRAYDEPFAGGVPRGNLLSQTLGLPFAVRRGVENRIGVVLEGVPVSLVVSADPGEDVGGDQVAGFVWYGAFSADGSTSYPRTFTVAPLDADGNVIAGLGSPAISITSSNTSAFGNGVAVPYTTDRFTVALPPGLPTFRTWIPMTATATPPLDASAAPVSVTFSMQVAGLNAPVVFVTDQSTGPSGLGRIWAFDENGQPVAAVQNKLDAAGPYGGPAGIAYCSVATRVVTVAEFTHKIYAFLSDGTFERSGSTSYVPLGIACSETDDVFVGNDSAPVTYFDEFTLLEGVTGGTWNEPLSASLPYTPWGLVQLGNTVYLADEANGSLNEYSPDGTAIGGSVAAPTGIMAFDGEIYYTQRYENDVVNLSEGFPAGAFSGLNLPFGISGDPANGYIYIVNWGVTNGTSVVTRYDRSGNAVPLPANAFRGPVQALDIAITQ